MRVKYTEHLIILVYMLSFVLHICAYSTSNGKGIYQTYNSKKSLTSATKKDPEKFFLGGSGSSTNDHISRAPSHDTPASPCKCSKCNFFNIIFCLSIAHTIDWID